MFDTSPYLTVIAHSKDRNFNIEQSALQAFKIDDADGIAENIGFNTTMLNKVDYFLEKNNFIQLIELSDLKEDIVKCNAKIKDEFLKIEQTSDKNTFKTKQKKAAKKEAWKSVAYEFSKKWSGSIAVIERLYRKTHRLTEDPKYSLLIVCKNETEIRMLDDFSGQLNGMMAGVAPVKICTTETLNLFLITL